MSLSFALFSMSVEDKESLIQECWMSNIGHTVNMKLFRWVLHYFPECWRQKVLIQECYIVLNFFHQYCIISMSDEDKKNLNSRIHVGF